MFPDDTWTCHVCKEERPDAAISVFKRDHHEGAVKFTENIRYCNDRVGCAAGAPTVNFLTVKDASTPSPPWWMVQAKAPFLRWLTLLEVIMTVVLVMDGNGQAAGAMFTAAWMTVTLAWERDNR